MTDRLKLMEVKTIVNLKRKKDGRRARSGEARGAGGKGAPGRRKAGQKGSPAGRQARGRRGEERPGKGEQKGSPAGRQGRDAGAQAGSIGEGSREDVEGRRGGAVLGLAGENDGAAASCAGRVAPTAAVSRGSDSPCLSAAGKKGDASLFSAPEAGGFLVAAFLRASKRPGDARTGLCLPRADGLTAPGDRCPQRTTVSLACDWMPAVGGLLRRRRAAFELPGRVCSPVVMFFRRQAGRASCRPCDRTACFRRTATAMQRRHPGGEKFSPAASAPRSEFFPALNNFPAVQAASSGVYGADGKTKSFEGKRGARGERGNFFKSFPSPPANNLSPIPSPWRGRP